MNNTTRKLFALILILTLSTLACSTFSSGANTETINNAEADSNTTANTNNNDSGTSGGISFSNNPATLNLDDPTLYEEFTTSNYTVSMDFNISATGADGSSIFRQILLSGERNVDPPASFMLMQPNDPAVMEGIEYFEIAHIEGIDYVNVAGLGCSVFANEEFNNPYDSLADTGGFLTGEAERIGTDIINDTKVDVYEITAENLDPADETTRDIQELKEGYLYLSYEGSIIGIYLTGTGSSELLAGTNAVVGDVVYDLNFTPTTEQFEIVPPADCADTADVSYPVLDDAQLSSSVVGFYSYVTSYEFDAIINFYKTEMAALGHTLTSEYVYAPTATLTFTKAEGGAVNVVISQNPAGEGFQILILEE